VARFAAATACVTGLYLPFRALQESPSMFVVTTVLIPRASKNFLEPSSWDRLTDDLLQSVNSPIIKLYDPEWAASAPLILADEGRFLCEFLTSSL
jgi:hypothetical protein